MAAKNNFLLVWEEMFALCHILPSLESGLNYVLLRKIVIIKHKIRGKEDPCPRACGKRTGGMNERGREREMGTKTDRTKGIFSYSGK